MKAVLTIAGSDSSGGAGIQADIKTIEAMGLYAESAITALTAQNTTGVSGVVDIAPDFVTKQIDAVFDDIRPDAVKIGMVSQTDIIEAISRALVHHEAKHIVVDPVMVATSGSKLISDDAVDALKAWLFPLAEVITPNVPEAEALCGFHITDKDSMQRAADDIAALVQEAQAAYEGAITPGTPAILIKGGHDIGDGTADDLLRTPEGNHRWLPGERIDTKNTHGTGCTLSSAIAVGLAQGMSPYAAVRDAKEYVTGALKAGLNLGKGSGPLDHMYRFR